MENCENHPDTPAVTESYTGRPYCQDCAERETHDERNQR